MLDILLDTGPLIALLNGKADHHEWVADVWANSRLPALTVEPVLSEAIFILHRERLSIDPLFELLARSVLVVDLRVGEEIQDIWTLMKRYYNRPMSLADACLVRLSELRPNHQLLTFDSDFEIYRKHGNKVIPLLTPDKE